ncbi:unnamed protein product [Symbiodinium microadriaticum]|nr:unnamed protein product [Symbiodinium microadriaticum]
MREMRVYLENLQHHQRGSRSVDSKGQQKDSSVTSLINSRLFAAYAGIVMVPDPAENPAYAALFDPKWRLNLRLKLISFLEGLRDLPAEEVSQAMLQKNKSTPQSAGVAAPVFSASLTGRRNSAGISPHSRRPEGLPTTTGRSSSVSAVSHAEVSQWRQSDRSGDHFDDGAREGRVRMRRSGSGESGTGLEAETEMMKVLSTLEASEKLNKALRDDSLNSASIAADATRQYRASVPREHIPAGTGSSGTGGGLGGGHVPQSQLFARIQAERDAGRTHSGPAGTDPSAAAGKSSWTREGIAMADGSPGSMPPGGPLSIDRNMGADVECPPGVKSGRDDSKNDGNRDYEDDGDSLSSGEDDVCIPSAEELAHQDSEEEDPRSNAASATTGMDDKRSTEKKSSRRMSAMLGSGTMVMEIVSEEDETHRDDNWFGEEKTHVVTKTNAETPAAAAANSPSGESRRGTSLTLSQLRAASTQRDSAEPAATVAFVEPPGVSSATKGEAVIGEPAVVEANARPKKSLRFHSDDAIDTVHFIDTTAPVKGDVGSSVARIEHGDESRVRDDLSHADDIWLVADQETAKTAKEEAAVPIEESSPVILSVTPPRRMSALLSEMTKQTSSSVSGSSVAISVGTEDVSVDAPMDAGSAAHVLSPPSSPLLSSLSGMSGDDTVVPPGPAAPVPFSPSENGDTEHKSRIGANTSSSLHQSSTLSLSPDHTGLDDEVVAPPISEPALSLWRCRDDSDSDDGESCEHAIVPAENASTSDQTEPAGNAYITYLRQNFKGLEDASSDADGCVDQQTSIQRSESATSGDYGDDDDNDFALQQELGMCTLKGQFMVLPEGQHDSPVISSGSSSAKVRRKSWDPPLMGEYSQMHSASDTPSPQAMSPISPDDCISGELASSPPSRSPCGSGDACASQSDDEDGTIPADVNGSDGILSSGGTLAGSLFRHLEGVSAGGMEPVALAATEAEEKQSAFKSARNSKISDLMAKFSHAPLEKTVAGDWDGWEQVGSRWLKKNPMSPEEIEVAASFYGSTRRHAKDGSRRQSDVSDAGQQAKSAEWSRAGETDTSLFQSVDARWSESKQQQDTDDIATVRQSTAYDVL